MMKAALGATLAIVFLTGSQVGSTTSQNSAAGFWQQADNDGHVGAWFYFEEVKGRYEGRLVKLFKQPGEQNQKIVETCAKCPGPQKNARMLGLTIVKGMRRDGLKYEDGTILDPRDGTVYHAQMELSPDGQKLYVRGYIGVPLLGQTQTWTRLPDDSIAADAIPKETVGADAQQGQAGATVKSRRPSAAAPAPKDAPQTR